MVGDEQVFNHLDEDGVLDDQPSLDPDTNVLPEDKEPEGEKLLDDHFRNFNDLDEETKVRFSFASLNMFIRGYRTS